MPRPRFMRAGLFAFSRIDSSSPCDGAKLSAHHRRHGPAKDLYRIQHFLVRQSRDTHLERDARYAAENVVHIKDLFRDRLGIADQQCASGSALPVELSPCCRWPAAFLADFGKRVRIPRKKYFRGFLRALRQKANRMKT